MYEGVLGCIWVGWKLNIYRVFLDKEVGSSEVKDDFSIENDLKRSKD